MRLLDEAQIAAGFLPVDLQTATASPRQGDWVSLERHRNCAVILYKDGGAAGEDVTLTLEQARDAAGAGAKALNFTEVYRKQGADLTALAQWTRTAKAASNTYTNDTSAEQELLWVVEVDAAALDAAGGFRFVRAGVNDVGGAPQLGCLLYVLTGPRYADAPDKAPGVTA